MPSISDFYPFSFIEKVVFTVTVITQKNRPFTQFPPTHVSVRPNPSQVIGTMQYAPILKKQTLGVCIHPKDKVKVATISQIDNFVVFLDDRATVQKPMIDTCR